MKLERMLKGTAKMCILLILAKGGARTKQAHNNCMHI